MKIFNLFVLLLLFGSAKGQYVPNYKSAADVYFSKQEYYAASEYYKKALNINSDSTSFVVPYTFAEIGNAKDVKQNQKRYLVFRLAESLRLYRNYKDAERWYALAKDFPEIEYQTASYWHASSLQKLSKYQEAIIAYERALAKFPNHELGQFAAKQIESSKFALKSLSRPQLIKISPLAASINEKGANYAAVMFEENIFFTSSRPLTNHTEKITLARSGKNKIKQKKSPFINSIYKISKTSSDNSSAERLNFANALEKAAPAISANGKIMYFTGWTADEKKYAIYASTKNNEGWGEPELLSLEINVKNFNAMQPSISSDGTTLIFSSDRPGGYGKFDLWYSKIRSDGSFSQAINMGVDVNTKDDEQAGVYNNVLKKLIFSTNGRIGMGGLDLYQSNGELWDLNKPENLGYPLNSSKDDIYFSSSDSSWQEGFISSDRESICCLEIFSFKKEFIQIKGKILDCDTGLPLADVKVILTDSISTESQTTDSIGNYHFTLSSRKAVSLQAEKDDYFSKILRYPERQIAAIDTLLNTEICLKKFVLNKPIVIENVFYDFNSAELTDTSKIVLIGIVDLMLDNPAIEIEFSSHTDSKGSEEYNMDLSEQRAQSCVTFLISNGISSSRLTSKGYGESKPIAANTLPNGKDNPEGRQMNRRTEFRVTKK